MPPPIKSRRNTPQNRLSGAIYPPIGMITAYDLAACSSDSCAVSLTAAAAHRWVPACFAATDARQGGAAYAGDDQAVGRVTAHSQASHDPEYLIRSKEASCSRFQVLLRRWSARRSAGPHKIEEPNLALTVAGGVEQARVRARAGMICRLQRNQKLYQ